MSATDIGSIKASLTLETQGFREGTERAKKELGGVAESAQKSSKSMKELAESMKKAADTREQIGKLTTVLDNVGMRIVAQERKLKDLHRQYTETFDRDKKNKINDKILATESALISLNAKADVTTKKIEELEDSLSSASNKFDLFGDSAKSSVAKVGVAFAALSAAMTVAIKKAVDTAAEFESSMAKVKAISGATGAEFKALEDQAISLGATTVFTASQAADAQGFLAMAGFKTNEILAAMPGVLNLAAAGQMDLARTADIASNILTGFNLNASETDRVVDVLAKAMTNANTNIEQLGKQHCPVVRKLAA